MKPYLLVTLCFVLLATAASAQEAVSALDRARLFQPAPSEPVPTVDENGNAIGAVESNGDGSFGAQSILKDQPRVRAFTLNGGGSIFFTNNVALTRSDTQDDVFGVLNAAGSWNRTIRPGLDFSAGLQGAAFRYERSSVLDFDSLGGGTTLSWSPAHWSGVNISGRYEFTELLNRHGNELLRDHQLSLGAQKTFALGRAHALTVGALGSVGFSNPSAAQRDQAGLFASYQLQLTRSLSTDVLYRIAGQFYNDGGRSDLNQTFSWNLRYRLSDWGEANVNFTFGSNRSSTAVFDYDAASVGGGLGFLTRF